MGSKKLDLRRVPRDFRRGFGWALESARFVQNDPLAFVDRPATSFARLERRMEAIIDREIAEGGPEGFVRRLFAPIAHLPDREVREAPRRLAKDVARRRRRVARLPGGSELLTLMERAHRTIRNAPLLAMQDPLHHAKATLEAARHVANIRGTRGETRARAMLDAIAGVWEAVYQPYLRSIWKLIEVGAGRALQNPPNQGPLVAALEEMLTPDVAGLLEPTAVRIRNAVAHRRVEYLPGQRAVTLKNKDGWAATFLIADLEEILHKMFMASTQAYDDAMNAFVEEAIMRPLLPRLPAFARAVVADDRNEVERLGKLMNSDFTDAWSEVAAFCGPHAASSPS